MGNNKVEKSNYKEIAQQIINEIGTSENIVSAAHCATRLRLVIKSNEKVNKEAIENIDGVKGVFFASGQLQIIFGTGVVNKVYEEFAQLTGQGEVSKEELKQAASANDNKFKKIIKTLGDVFVPIIPAIVAGGLMMGLTESINFCVSIPSSLTCMILYCTKCYLSSPVLPFWLSESAAEAVHFGSVLSDYPVPPYLHQKSLFPPVSLSVLPLSDTVCYTLFPWNRYCIPLSACFPPGQLLLQPAPATWHLREMQILPLHLLPA